MGAIALSLVTGCDEGKESPAAPSATVPPRRGCYVDHESVATQPALAVGTEGESSLRGALVDAVEVTPDGYRLKDLDLAAQDKDHLYQWAGDLMVKRCARQPRPVDDHADGDWLAHDGIRIWYSVRGPSDAPAVVLLHGGPGYNGYVFEETIGGGTRRAGAAGRARPAGLRTLREPGRGVRAWARAHPSRRRGAAPKPGPRALEGRGPFLRWAHRCRLRPTPSPRHLGCRPRRDHPLVAARPRAPDPHRQRGCGRALARPSGCDPRPRGRPRRHRPRAVGPAVRPHGASVAPALLHWRDPAHQRRADAWDEASGLLQCTRREVVDAYAVEGLLDGTNPTVARPLPRPGRLIGGRHSQVVGEAELARAAEVWGVDLVWMEASGHFPYVEEPTAFAAAVAAAAAAFEASAAP